MNAFASHALPTLLGLLVKGTLLLMLAGTTCVLLRRASAATRHLVWTYSLLAVLLLPLLSLALPHWPIAYGGRPAAAPAPESLPAPTAADNALPQNQSAVKPSAPVLPDPSSPSDAANSAPLPTAPAPRAPRPFPAKSVLAAVGLVIWLLGALFILVRLAVGLRRVGRLAYDAAPLKDAAHAVADATKLQIGLRRPVRFLQAADASAVPIPITWGLLCPIVLLPVGSRDWSEDCLRAALLHELAHIQRADWPTQLLARLACALYWWHPLVWLAARQARAESERACDDLVLSTGIPPVDYAQRLVEVVRSLPAGARPGTVAIAMAQPLEVEGRIAAILDARRSRRRLSRSRQGLTVAAVPLLLVPLSILQPVKAGRPPFTPYAELSGQIIVIDPGHGGQDWGAVGTGGVVEKTLDFAIAQRLRSALEGHGATVYLTRDGDTFLPVMARPAFAAEKHADYFIGIHCDDRTPQEYGAAGALVYFHDHAPLDQRLAGRLILGLSKATGEPSRAASDLTRFQAGFGVLRSASMPAVLIECGNMYVPSELKRLMSVGGQQQIATGIAVGLIAFYHAPARTAVANISNSLKFVYLKDVSVYGNSTPRRPYLLQQTPPPYGNGAYSLTDAKTGRQYSMQSAAWAKVLRDSPVIMTGADVEPETRVVNLPATTNLGTGQQTTRPVIYIRYSPAGAKKMQAFSATHQGDVLATILDGKILIAPIIEGTISGATGEIDLNDTPAEAQSVADRINAAAQTPPQKAVAASAPPVPTPPHAAPSNPRDAAFLDLWTVNYETNTLEIDPNKLKAALNNGANVETRFPFSQTALMTAAAYGRVDIAQILLAHGADVNARDYGGQTALMLAASYGLSDACVRLMLQHGADVNAANRFGATALISAAAVGNADCVKLLLQHGADVHAVFTYKGRHTALSQAKKNGAQAVMRLLEAAGETV